MYRPVFYVNDAVNGYPKPLGRTTLGNDLTSDATVTHTVGTAGITGTYVPAGSTDPQVKMSTVLHGRRVVFDYRLASGSATPGRLAIRLFPGYGVLWRGLRQDAGGLSFVSDPFTLTGVSTAGAHGVGVTITPVGKTQLDYLERDPQFGLQSVELTAPSNGHVTFSVDLDTATAPHRPTRFDQASLIRRYHITDVVLWKDTGWKSRFDPSECFVQTQETNRLLIFRVKQSCGRSISPWRIDSP
jgi:hypothetical protein